MSVAISIDTIALTTLDVNIFFILSPHMGQNGKFSIEIESFPPDGQVGYRPTGHTLASLWGDQKKLGEGTIFRLACRHDWHSTLSGSFSLSLGFVTRYAQGVISNPERIYTFQGLTGDGKTCVAATLPLSETGEASLKPAPADLDALTQSIQVAEK
jgi:hypothetical protein